MNERWLAIAGWEGLYEVSDMGRVRSCQRVKTLHHGGKRTYGGKILIGGPSNGYVLVNFRDGDKHKSQYVHILVLEAFVGPCPEGMEGCHGNGKRFDNRLSNLRWGTPKSNHQDRVRHETDFAGERNPNAILTEADVIAIRRLNGNAALREMAAKLGVTFRCVEAVRYRESWRHVRGAENEVEWSDPGEQGYEELARGAA